MSQFAAGWRWLVGRVFRVLALLVLLASTGSQAAEHAVLFITSAPVQAAKFRLLDEVARPNGVRIEVRYVEKLPRDVDARLFEGYALVLFDTPRDHLRDMVQGRLAAVLPGLRQASFWLHDTRPTWRGLPDAVARQLHPYYMNGGRRNFDGFFKVLAAHLEGRAAAGVAEPIVFPETAVYHPKAPHLVFNDPHAFLKWKGVDERSGQRPPVIAIAMHQTYIAAEQTAFIDDLVARIEAGGALAMPFYSPVMGANDLREMTMPGGQRLVDVLINTQIMLNPEHRRKEFAALGVPVIQAMTYRKGDEAAWAADPQGVTLMDVPFYLAQSEYAGVTDIQVAAAIRKQDEAHQPIAAQAATVAAKALNLARLQRKANADKKIAVFYWNYPPGEKNLSASFMNLPRSLESTLAALKAHGYTTETPTEPELIGNLQQLLRPFYRDDALDALLAGGNAELLPVHEYRRWLESLPAFVGQAMTEKFGPPEKSAMVVRRQGVAYFVIPRYRIGNVAILPQPPRGEKWQDQEKALYHSTKAPPSHFYYAVYLWARQQHQADAIVHYGTHGSQEWLPGKERGLSVFDYPMLALGDLPVAYPYIADNIGEATQAKRRGRATIVSHQTPPFRPAGLHESLTKMHDLLHAWLAQDEGAVKDKIRDELIARVSKERIERDMGWTPERMRADFPIFVNALHDHLHELGEMAQPLGLHTFGRAPDEKHRLATVMLMLGRSFWEAAALQAGGKPEDSDETLIADYERLTDSAPYHLLQRHVIAGESADRLSPALQKQLEQARRWYADLGAGNENPALLAVLDGQYLPTSYGGDPLKNPDAYPTGRNLYGFDPSRVPTQQAWEAGKDAAEKLLAEHRRLKGVTPKKLTFSLWSVETMRHQGLLEAQALWLMGVEPVWDEGGRVISVKRVSRAALGRPRVDVVLSATGLYRDHFPNAMKQLARAVQLAAEAADEPDNPLAANARALTERLIQQGVAPEVAKKAGQTRIFSSESGRYGTGLDDATLATDSWQGKAEGDQKLARLYLSRMQFAYGPDEADWGKSGDALIGSSAGRTGLNLYAEHLKGTEGAVLSRTSNTYGMLTTDDPFQYLGGIGLAVRHLDGKAPELYISNLRGQNPRAEGAAGFLAKELATRNFHPGYIKGLMKEGYAGTLQVVDGMNNFWGWTAVAREIVRDDQWQEFVDVYVRDKHQLGLKKWFERHNPHALAQTMERMLEAARQGYWQADAKTIAELKQRYRELAARHDVKTDNARFNAYVGYGVATAAAGGRPVTAAQARPPQPAQPAAPLPPPPPPVQGMRLEKVTPPDAPDMPPLQEAIWLVLGLVVGSGAWRQRRVVA
jgi:cobaltochelatase CobN